MGPIFGVMMVDYYLIAKGVVNVPALYQENGEYRFTGGWNWAYHRSDHWGFVLKHPAEPFTPLLSDWIAWPPKTELVLHFRPSRGVSQNELCAR